MEKQKVLLVRVDRMGDLLCTLPAELHPAFANKDITWLIATPLQFVAKRYDTLSKFINVPLEPTMEQKTNLLRILKEQQFDECLIYHAPWWISLLIWKAGIQRRMGKVSKWHSLLFLNYGQRQSRKDSIKHEFVYNWELTNLCYRQSIDYSAYKTLPRLNSTWQPQFEKKWGLSKKNYIVVHPGMAGSALNWSQQNYRAWIENESLNTKVVITGTHQDQNYLTELRTLKERENIIWAVDAMSGEELIDLLAHASLVLAPSTGVAHLAAATGAIVWGIYSPIKRQSSLRWKPRGKNVTVFAPEVDCPAVSKCLESKCKFFPCMDRVQLPITAQPRHFL